MPLNESLLRHGAAPLVIAHRGASAAAPENTLPAFLAALDAGTLWIETDVQPTADDELILIHDDDVDRTTDGTGRVRDFDLAALRTLDAGSRFDPAFAGTRIPLLAELLPLITADRRLLLEIKGDHTIAQLRLILDLIERTGTGSRVFLQSFEIPVLERLRALRPTDPIGLLVEVIEGDPVAQCRRLGAMTYNPDVLEIVKYPGLVAELHAAGIAIQPWTADTEEQWTLLTDLGVDGIITDLPGELLAWQRGRSAAPADAGVVIPGGNPRRSVPQSDH